MMKTIPGRIRIKDQKIYFEPDGLEKPKIEKTCHSFWHSECVNKGIMCEKCSEFYATKKFKAYLISKQLVKVNNDYDSNSIKIKGKGLRYWYKDRQPCKAEINKEHATIISLIKQK